MLNRVQFGHDPVTDLFAMALGPEKIGLWRLSRGAPAELSAPDARAVEGVIKTRRHTLRGLAFVAPSILLSLHASGELACWRVASAAGELLEEAELLWEIALPMQPGVFWPFEDYRDENFCIALGGKTGEVAFLKPAGAKKPQILWAGEAHRNDITALAFGPRGTQAASAGRGRTIKIWPVGQAFSLLADAGQTSAADSEHTFDEDLQDDVELAEIVALRRLSGFEAWTLCLAFSHDGARLASGGMDDTVYLWDLQPDAATPLLATAHEHHGWVADIAWAPDDSAIAAASWDNTIGVYQVDPLKKLHSLRGHKDYVSNLRFIPDTHRLISTSYDEYISVWDWHTAARLEHLPAHSDWVLGLSLLDDGRFLTVAGDRTANVWAGDPPECIIKLGESSWQWTPETSEVETTDFPLEVLSGQSINVLKSIFDTSEGQSTDDEESSGEESNDERSSVDAKSGGEPSTPNTTPKTPPQHPDTMPGTVKTSADMVPGTKKSSKKISKKSSARAVESDIWGEISDESSDKLDVISSLNELSDEELAVLAALSSDVVDDQIHHGPTSGGRAGGAQMGVEHAVGDKIGDDQPDKEGQPNKELQPNKKTESAKDRPPQGDAERADLAAVLAESGSGDAAASEELFDFLDLAPEDFGLGQVSAKSEPMAAAESESEELSDHQIASFGDKFGDQNASLDDKETSLDDKETPRALESPTDSPKEPLKNLRVRLQEQLEKQQRDISVDTELTAQDQLPVKEDPFFVKEDLFPLKENSTLSEETVSKSVPGAALNLSPQDDPDVDFADDYEPVVDEKVGNTTNFGMPASPSEDSSSTEPSSASSSLLEPAASSDSAGRAFSSDSDEYRAAERASVKHTTSARSGTLTGAKPLGRLTGPTPGQEGLSGLYPLREKAPLGLGERTAPREVTLAQAFKTPVSLDMPRMAEMSELADVSGTADMPEMPSSGRLADFSSGTFSDRALVGESSPLGGMDADELKIEDAASDDLLDAEFLSVDVSDGQSSAGPFKTHEQPRQPESDSEVVEFLTLWKRYLALPHPKMGIIRRRSTLAGSYRRVRAFQTERTDDRDVRLSDLACATDAKTFGTCGPGGVVDLWQHTGELLERLWGDATGHHALVLAGRGRLVFAAGENGDIEVWLLDEHEREAGDDGRRIYRARLRGHQAPIRALAISADERQLLSGDEQGVIRQWDLSEAASSAQLLGHHGRVRALSFLGNEIISAGADGTLRQWSPAGLQMDQLDVSPGACCLAGEGKNYVWGDESGGVFLYHAGKRLALKTHQGTARAVCVDNKHLVASAGADGYIHIYRRGEVSPLESLYLGEDEPADIAAISLADQDLLVASRSGMISIYSRRSR